ncbi:MAG: hydroxymyristoyl-ACP dehydratase [Treponema sp.]|nr:hydroxymyristoyl-ACP dehydratase [Treponema sp.]
MSNINNIKEEKIINKTDNSIILEFSISGSSDYFDGHFPGFPVLPAVAQVFIIMQYVSRFFGISIKLSEIKRTKLINKIRPDVPLVLYLEKKEKIISFKIISPNNETMYSAGTLVLPEVM